ncbi:response regulator transcription factor [Enterococcus sp. LJL98]
MSIKIFLVEDDEMTREGIEAYLLAKNYQVMVAADGERAWSLFKRNSFDLVILDVMLPKEDGFQVLQKIRKVSEVPVLMLTAMNDESTQVLSFNSQADDYMSKPFSLVVLEKRIEALLKRTKKAKELKLWHNQDAFVDFVGYQGMYQGKVVDLKPKEIQVLKLLITHKNQVLSREQILSSLWTEDEAPLDRVIDVYIKNLRKKLGLNCLVTVKGVGYKYEESKENE